MKKFNYRLTLSLLIVAAFALFAATGCSTGSSANNNTGTDLLVVSTSPSDGGTASHDAIVEINFNLLLNPDTVTNDNIYVTDSAGNRIPGDLFYQKVQTRVTFTSDSTYTIGETYTCYITTGLRSIENKALDSEYIFSFTVTD